MKHNGLIPMPSAVHPFFLYIYVVRDDPCQNINSLRMGGLISPDCSASSRINAGLKVTLNELIY